MTRRSIVFAFATLLVAVACSSSSGSSGATTTPSSTTAMSPTASASAGGEVTIQEVDFSFQPNTINANASQAIKIINKGVALHNFSIEGTSIDVDTEPGQTTTLEALGPNFAPGTYTFFCKYHRSQRMVGTLVASAA
jgi:plastocyanin